MARPTQTWCTLIQRRTRPTQRIQLVAARRGLLIGGADEPSSRSLRELVPAIAAVEKCQPRRSGQRGNRLARKSSQCRTPHQQGELGRQPIRRRVGRPAHSIQFRRAPRAGIDWRDSDARTARSPAQSAPRSARLRCATARSAATGSLPAGAEYRSSPRADRPVWFARQPMLAPIVTMAAAAPRCGSARCRASGEAAGPCPRRR